MLGRCRPATGTCEALQGKSSISYTVSDKAAQLTPHQTTPTTASSTCTDMGKSKYLYSRVSIQDNIQGCSQNF